MQQERCLLFAMTSGNVTVTFNANKSKCILFLSCNKPARSFSVVNPVFYIGGNVIQYMNEWPHLGHIISANNDDARDMMSRRFSLIGQINSILCNFRNVDCSTKIRLIKAYCTIFTVVNFETYLITVLKICVLLGDVELGRYGVYPIPLTRHCFLACVKQFRCLIYYTNGCLSSFIDALIVSH